MAPRAASWVDCSDAVVDLQRVCLLGRCHILMYHMVSEPRTVKDRRFAISPRRFEDHLRGLADRGFRFVSLDDVAGFVEGGQPLPEQAVAITLDDGYEDNYSAAFPILRRHRVPATVFLVSGRMGGANSWMEGRGFSERRMMSWPQARELSAHGIDLGGHTVSHVRLPEIDPEAARREIADCKRAIEDELGKEIRHFAYPYGLLDDAAREAVADAGFRTACSTRAGPNAPGTDRLVLRRIEAFGTDSVTQLIRKMRFGTHDSSLTVPLRYYWSRLQERLS